MGFNKEDIDNDEVQASIEAGTKIVLSDALLRHLIEIAEAATETDTPPAVIALTGICMYLIYLLGIDKVSIVDGDGNVQVHVVDTQGIAGFMKKGAKLQ